MTTLHDRWFPLLMLTANAFAAGIGLGVGFAWASINAIVALVLFVALAQEP